jgi:formamidopyrimidine-DNA glycosylase
MPEMPEVEAFRHYIAAHCLHKKIVKVDTPGKSLIKKGTTDFKKKLVHYEFTKVEREGKYLVIAVSSGKKLIMHFGLTGFVVIAKAGEKINYSRAVFTFSNKKSLHWCDIRKFGKLWLVNSIDEVQGLKTLGPDPLKLSYHAFSQIMKDNERKNIKALLMDQSILAGIGNEYSDEILFQAGIDPHHAIKDLSAGQLKKIYSCMKRIMHYAMKLRIKNSKKLGKQQLFSVDDDRQFKSSYLIAHRHGDHKCPNNSDHMLKKATIGGRSSYYCPKDQK